jgi:hypothetical protein
MLVARAVNRAHSAGSLVTNAASSGLNGGVLRRTPAATTIVVALTIAAAVGEGAFT